MLTYRTHVVIKNPHQILFSDLPFRVGEHVEVLFLALEEKISEERELALLLNDTQSLPQIQTLTEEDIVKEITAFRAGR